MGEAGGMAAVMSLVPNVAARGVVTPVEGWSQMVPNEGNPHLILRLDRLIRSVLLPHDKFTWKEFGEAVVRDF